MSLNPSQLLIQPAKLIQPADVNQLFHTLERNQDIFKDIVGLEEVKRILLNSIYAFDPVHIILVGPPGNGKTLFLQAVLKAFTQFSLFIDSTISSGIGMIEGIFDRAHSLRFLLVDEIEKFSRRDRKVLLNLLETGIVSRSLRNERRLLTDMKVWFFATCNNINQIQTEQPELLNRCIILTVPALNYNKFEYVASIRLQREQGINTEEIAKYVAFKVFTEFDATDMRKCIQICRLANSQAQQLRKEVDREVVDGVISRLKGNIHIFN
jgi:replication-associated recombination protein RarA